MPLPVNPLVPRYKDIYVQLKKQGTAASVLLKLERFLAQNGVDYTTL